MPPNTLQQPPTNLVDRRLGRMPEFDQRSLEYPMRSLEPSKKRIFSKKWKIRQYINQRQTPRCVTYSIIMEVGMQPYYHNITDFLADIMYPLAQDIDYWPGNNYDGTSCLAGMTIAKKMGLIPEFRWALKPNPVDDICRMLSNVGPVEMGTNWYPSMYTPGADGLVTIQGNPVGGHAWCINELDWQKKRVYSANTWGDAGFWISLDDLERLIFEDGEAVIPTRRD